MRGSQIDSRPVTPQIVSPGQGGRSVMQRTGLGVSKRETGISTSIRWRPRGGGFHGTVRYSYCILCTESVKTLTKKCARVIHPLGDTPAQG